MAPLFYAQRQQGHNEDCGGHLLGGKDVFEKTGIYGDLTTAHIFFFLLPFVLLLNPTHHLQHLSGDHLHAAHGRGQRAHDGGDDVEGTNTKQQLLNEGDIKEDEKTVNKNISLHLFVCLSRCRSSLSGDGLQLLWEAPAVLRSDDTMSLQHVLTASASPQKLHRSSSPAKLPTNQRLHDSRLFPDLERVPIHPFGSYLLICLLPTQLQSPPAGADDSLIKPIGLNHPSSSGLAPLTDGRPGRSHSSLENGQKYV